MNNNTSDSKLDRVAIVTDLWRSLLPVVVPNPYQIRTWLAFHDLATVCFGVRECARKYQRINGRMDARYAVRFASKVMNNRSNAATTRQQGMRTVDTKAA
jgi:hypothetical protein